MVEMKLGKMVLRCELASRHFFARKRKLKTMFFAKFVDTDFCITKKGMLFLIFSCRI